MIYAVCHSYYRLIRKNKRTYEAVPEKFQPGVKELAKSDVQNGVISEDDYKAYIGEDYES